MVISKRFTEIAELATDWYGQSHEILIIIKYSEKDEVNELSAIEIFKKHKLCLFKKIYFYHNQHT